MTVRLVLVDLPQIPDHKTSLPHVAGRLARSCTNMRRHYFGMFHGQFTTDRTTSLDEGLWSRYCAGVEEDHDEPDLPMTPGTAESRRGKRRAF